MLIVEWIRFILGALLVIFGLFLFAIEVFGSYKFDFVLNRMHGFYTNDKRFLDEEYLKDILGTIEII